MTFWEHFFRLLSAGRCRRSRRSIGISPAASPGPQSAARASADLASPTRVDRATRADFERSGRISRGDGEWARKPSFSVLLHGVRSYTPDELQRSIASMDRQIYPDFGLIDPGVRQHRWMERSTGLAADFIVPLRIGDVALRDCASSASPKPFRPIRFEDLFRRPRSPRRNRAEGGARGSSHAGTRRCSSPRTICPLAVGDRTEGLRRSACITAVSLGRATARCHCAAPPKTSCMCRISSATSQPVSESRQDRLD